MHRFCSALVVVTSLLAGVFAAQELTLSSASALAPTFKFYEDHHQDGFTGNVQTYAHFKTETGLWTHEMTLTIELWYEKFNPETGGYTPARACSQALTNRDHYEIAFNYTCKVPSRARIQVRASVTGYDHLGAKFSHNGASKWEQL